MSLLSIDPSAVTQEIFYRNDLLKPVSMGFLEAEKEETSGKSLLDLINENLQILDIIDFPKHLEKETVREFLRKAIEEEMQRDPLHQASLRISKYTKDLRTNMKRYFDEIFDFHEKLKEHIYENAFITSRIYLDSDLPALFSRDITHSLFTWKRYIDIFDRRIRKEYIHLVATLNNLTKFRRVCNVHNSWVKTVAPLIDRMNKTRVSVIWYIDICNSKTVEDIFEPKMFKMAALDRKEIYRLLSKLKQETQLVRQRLVDLDRDNFTYIVDRTDPTVEMLCEIIQFID